MTFEDLRQAAITANEEFLAVDKELNDTEAELQRLRGLWDAAGEKRGKAERDVLLAIRGAVNG
jgi:hypothetical protein